MNRFRIVVMGAIAIILSVAIFNIKVYAIQSSFDYETSYNAAFSNNISNYNNSSLAVYANTRPTAGINGVKVTIAYTNGEVIKSDIFPYQASRGDMVGYVKSGRIARIGVLPVVDGQKVKGTLYYHY